jgi:hypothetical protein
MRKKRMDKNLRSEDGENLRVNRGKLSSLDIYDVSCDELDKLERGGPDSIFLNFAIFSVSIALSFLTTLLTTNITVIKLYATFLVLTILGFLSGVILFILWWKNKTYSSSLIKKIRDRIPKKN